MKSSRMSRIRLHKTIRNNYQISNYHNHNICTIPQISSKRTISQSLHKSYLNVNNNNLIKLSKYCKYSSAFDPYWTLHQQNVTREQQDAFRQVWENNIGNFKEDLTDEELKLFQTKVDQISQIDEFEALLKGLWGPKRHHFIRKTRTFLYVSETILNWTKTSSNPTLAASSLIFGDDNNFNNFLESSKLKLNDNLGLLNDFIDADLRYMCSCIGIDYFCSGKTDDDIKITVVFGNRKKYHFGFPDPIGRSAHWMNCIYDRCNTSDLVLLTSINAVKENKPINTNYFKEKLGGLDHNALKEEEWRHHAESFSDMDPTMFADRFDRAFNAFQTDPGVSHLRARFDSDID